jgi:hypothetical protein
VRDLPALTDRPRPGRPQTVRRARRPEILAATLTPPPAELAPERAIVVCVDEKSQIQALGRTQPARRLRPGRIFVPAVAAAAGYGFAGRSQRPLTSVQVGGGPGSGPGDGVRRPSSSSPR